MKHIKEVLPEYVDVLWAKPGEEYNISEIPFQRLRELEIMTVVGKQRNNFKEPTIPWRSGLAL